MPDRILTINGGSSSIKFALFSTDDPPARLLSGQVERIGQADATLIVGDARHALKALNHEEATTGLLEWLREQLKDATLAGVGHRVVHSGLHLARSQIVN